MITYDGNNVEATMIITLKKEPVKDEEGNAVDFSLRVVIDTEGSRHDAGIDFDDGSLQAADDLQDVILGRIARFNWEYELKKLYQI